MKWGQSAATPGGRGSNRASAPLRRYLRDTVVDPESSFGRDRRAVLVVRISVLLVCVIYTLLSSSPETYSAAIVGLVVVAVVGSIPPVTALMRRWQPVVESVLAATVISLTDPLAIGLFPYLLVPALAAGLAAGVTGAVLAGGLAGAVGIVTHLDNLNAPDLRDLSRWVLLALGLGLFGAWVRRARPTSAASADVAAYSAAYQLLEQLRTVSRQLSGGLDPTTVAAGVAERVQQGLGVPGAVVVTRSDGGVLVPLARTGRVNTDIDEALERHATGIPWDGERPWAVDGTSWVPLRVGDRTVAMVVTARSSPSADRSSQPQETDGLAQTLHDDALRLETALLFDDLRSIATAEERSRLAREIHDGIAQELASLGYLVDGMLPAADDPVMTKDLEQLRAEIRRVVSELRLSIFDLRSQVSGGIGLGDALSSYVREVGQRAGLTVHLVLDEGPRRLSAGVEAELLRIAQEAVTNARKHAQARNLWVTCRVDPPRADVQIVDDGLGLGLARDDSYGMIIMAERAQRIGARLSVSDRADGGTVVRVVLEDEEAGPTPGERTTGRTTA